MTYTMEERYAVIRKICMESGDLNPLELAIEIMRQPEIRFHGPEHHDLTAAVLSTVLCRSQKAPIEPHLERLHARCRQIPPGVCGYYGVCGNTMAIGAVLSELYGVTYQSGTGWKRLNDLTAQAQRGIADSCECGPRCCKRTTFAVLLAAQEALEMGKTVVKCPFFRENPQCIQRKCRFFPDQV